MSLGMGPSFALPICKRPQLQNLAPPDGRDDLLSRLRTAKAATVAARRCRSVEIHRLHLELIDG
jgi:hypothetical protein